MRFRYTLPVNVWLACPAALVVLVLGSLVWRVVS
jgi:hypothetical protein